MGELALGKEFHSAGTGKVAIPLKAGSGKANKCFTQIV